jgi:DNA-binding response OmpR family regulator
LRKKIEDNPDDPAYILSVRGVGYKLREESTES